jgi:hypothetical protein
VTGPDANNSRTTAVPLSAGDSPEVGTASHWVTAGLIALVGTAALDICGRIAEIGPARFTVYQLLALAMTVLAVLQMTRGRTGLPRTPLNLPLAAFLAAAALSLAFATSFSPAVVQLASLASSVVLVLIVAVLVRSPRQGALVVGGVLAVAAVFGVLALLEWGDVFAVQHPVFYTPGYGIRARVTFLDPNILASFLMTAILLVAPLLASAPMRRGLRVLGVAGVAVTLAGLATTYSRGGLGGLVIGLVSIAVLLRAPRRARIAFVAVMMVAILLVGFLVFDARWVSENVVGAGSTGSATNRVYMVEGALKMWADHPFGVGLDNYQVVYPAYRDPRAEVGIVESHTAYVTVLAEMGFLGLLAFLWVLVSALFRSAGAAARRARDVTLQPLAAGAFAATLALAAQAFTYSIEASKFWWFAIGLGVAAWRMMRAESTPVAAPDRAAEGESLPT